MKQIFVCQVCKERLTLTGTPQGIEAAGKLWAQGHQHLLKATVRAAETSSSAPVAESSLLDARAER